MLALRRGFREVVVADEQFDGTNMGSDIHVMLAERFHATVGPIPTQKLGGQQKPWSSEMRAQHVDRIGTRKMHIPSDLVVDRGASSVSGSLILGFPCTPYPRPRNFPENNISNINMLNSTLAI
jgi:hypothetical protein